MSPAKGEKQRKLMGAVASGKVKKPGLSQATAKEILHGKNTPKRKAY